ncbi:hypothetical protein NBRC116188_14230 [Oceaniserpentilla sp. 4NH20-0058]|uniref:hypothetical protein n=1 Tax=Oceaniserpentilla sp. 4NH20-0058 TaxID=3127660 RepID=UPI00310A34D2
MSRSFKLITLFLLSFCLVACIDLGEDDKQNAEDCSAGDQEACDTLDEELELANEACDDGELDQCLRAAALDELIDSIPQGLIIASSTASADAGNSSEFESKKEAASAFLDTIRGATDLSSCLDAIPSQPQVSSPLCYGPALDYTDHPDSSSGTDDGQLPTGDLGLWVEDEPSTGEACAAAKLNELVAKAAYNVDLAVGSMGMMVCAAALLGEDLPENGATLDLSSQLSSISESSNQSGIEIETATVIHKTLSASTGYETHIVGTLHGQEIDLTVLHDSDNDNGLLTIEATEENNQATDLRGVSVIYELSSSQASYRMISSRAQPQGSSDPEVSYASDGQISLQAGEDIHVMQAQISLADGYGSLAYAWKAGGGDSHYRALNVVTESTGNGTGRAYYGYVPSPAASSEVIDLDLAATDAGMICNWAGPGNSHTPVDKVQYQALGLSSGEWTATSSNILYVPTTTCDMDANTGTFTPAFGGHNSSSHTPSTHEQTVIDNGTLDSSSAAITNDLLDKASIDFTLPSAPTAPQ